MAAKTREQELRAAMREARMPARCYKVYRELLDRAQYGTAEMTDAQGRSWGPRSLAELAGWVSMPDRTLLRVLDALEERGWIERRRPEVRGRRRHTTYRSNAEQASAY